MTWSQYWNYLHRQLYVMDTYCNDANKRLNHTMMALHPYLSLAFVIPTLTGVTQLHQDFKRRDMIFTAI